MPDRPERWADLQEAIREAEEEVLLLRCVLRCLLEEDEGRELTSLWRLTDYLEQHVGEIRLLSR